MAKYRHCVVKYRSGSKAGKCRRYRPGRGALSGARVARAVKKKAKTTRGWASAAPSTVGEKRALAQKCKKSKIRPFLIMTGLKYPIMSKSGPCVPNCQGLWAAKSRLGAMATTAKRAHRLADAKRFKRLQSKADGIGKRAGCHWAK